MQSPDIEHHRFIIYVIRMEYTLPNGELEIEYLTDKGKLWWRKEEEALAVFGKYRGEFRDRKYFLAKRTVSENIGQELL